MPLPGLSPTADRAVLAGASRARTAQVQGSAGASQVIDAACHHIHEHRIRDFIDVGVSD